MQEIPVMLTRQEIAALRSMLDVALKQLGRQAVQAFVVLDMKLAQASDPAQASPEAAMAGLDTAIRADYPRKNGKAEKAARA